MSGQATIHTSKQTTDATPALTRCGIVRWHIWIDGSTLFHSIDTTDGYERFLDEITALGPVDSVWDDIIAGILSPGDRGRRRPRGPRLQHWCT